MATQASDMKKLVNWHTLDMEANTVFWTWRKTHNAEPNTQEEPT